MLFGQEHVKQYVETDGEVGHDWQNGVPVLILTEAPDVQVQVKADRFGAHARTATPEEKADMWSTMAAIWPAYDEYQTRTDREIPVVVLERTG